MARQGFSLPTGSLRLVLFHGRNLLQPDAWGLRHSAGPFQDALVPVREVREHEPGGGRGSSVRHWQLFEEDLPKIGLGALWVRIDNTREGAISVKDARWTLRKGGRFFASLGAKDVLKRFYSGQGIRMYSVAAHEKARKGLDGLVLKAGTIPPSGFLEGFLFFKTDPGNRRWSTGAILSGRDIQLETRKEIEIELPISNANPGC